MEGSLSASNIRAQYLSKPAISKIAEDLLKSVGFNGKPPIDIEFIIERHLKLSILPVAQLKSYYGTDAYITSNFIIAVDKAHYDSNSVRYRFSLAHELAHFVLHSAIYKNLNITDVSSHISTQNKIPDATLKLIEQQAYRFAGCLLLPDFLFSAVINDKLCDDKLNSMTITELSNTIETISQDFNVSKDVVQRQLYYYYYYPTTYNSIKSAVGIW